MGDQGLPELMTASEACAYLRMKKTPAQAIRTMQHYRVTDQIKGARIGKQWLYPVSELRRFVETKLNQEEA